MGQPARAIKPSVNSVTLGRCRFSDPDVAELQRHRVFLQHHLSGWGVPKAPNTQLRFGKLLLIVDLDASDQRSRAGWDGFLAVRGEARSVALRFSINDLKGRLITLQERRRLDCGFEVSDERIADWRAGAGGAEFAVG